MNINPRRQIVLPIKEAVKLLENIERADPKLFNLRLRVTYKKYGASVYLRFDGWTASQHELVPVYLRIWAEFFPHYMHRVKIRPELYDAINMWVAPNVAGVEAIPIRAGKYYQFLEAQVSVVYQEYLDVVNNHD